MEQQANTINILLKISINAGMDHVWDCLINDVSLWWRKDFYTNSKTKRMTIEPKVGGRMYEDYGNDEGLLWATVIVLESPHLIEFKGHLTPRFGGPAMSFLRLSLKESGNSTVMTLEDTVFGAVSGKTRDDLMSGWKLLYEDAFKKYAEGKQK